MGHSFSSHEESAPLDGRAVPRLALADDHPDVLEEIRYLLEPEFRVVCSANQGDTLVQAVHDYRPDCVVTDVQMPKMNGVAAGREIVAGGLCDAVVMLTMYDDPQLIRTALEAGIRGYVLKEDAGEELIPALRAVLTEILGDLPLLPISDLLLPAALLSLAAAAGAMRPLLQAVRTEPAALLSE